MFRIMNKCAVLVDVCEWEKQLISVELSIYFFTNKPPNVDNFARSSKGAYIVFSRSCR